MGVPNGAISRMAGIITPTRLPSRCIASTTRSIIPSESVQESPDLTDGDGDGKIHTKMVSFQ